MHFHFPRTFSFFLRTLLPVCLLFPLVGHAQTYQLLWELSSGDSAPPSYLFGTMHVTDANMFQLPDSVLFAIEETEGFATEVAFDEALGEVLELIVEEEDGDQADLQARLMELLGGSGDAGTPDPLKLFENFGEPYEPGETMETFLDAFLYRIARDGGKVVGGLETIDAQMKRLLTNEDVFSAGGGKQGEAILKNAYLKGDLAGIQAYLESAAVPEAFRREVLIARNYSMAEVADSLMGLRPTFLAVGAGHLPGAEGMLALFRKMGYGVRPVGATYTGVVDGYLAQEYAPRWQRYEDAASGVRIDVPVKPFAMEVVEGEMDMHMGMDLPGGFFYAFYRMQLPFGSSEMVQDMVMEQVVSQMTEQTGDLESAEVVEGKFKGREMYGETSGYFFRTRIVFDEESMVFLMVGISEKAARGKAADHFMGSLETFEPRSVFEGAWAEARFGDSGFKADFPGKPLVESFSPIYDYPLYFEGRAFRYLVDEPQFSNSVEVRVVDLPPDYHMVKDSVHLNVVVSDFEERDDGRPSEVVFRNGMPGRETRIAAGGDSLHFRLVNRGLRTYCLIFKAGESDSPNTRADAFFDSFEYLPLPAPTPTISSSSPDLGERFLSLPLVRLEDDLRLSLVWEDSRSVWFAQDSLSGTGYVLKECIFPPYFRVNDLNDLLETYDEEVVEDPVPSDSVLQLDRFAYERILSPARPNDPVIRRQVLVSGDRLVVAEVHAAAEFDLRSEALDGFFTGFAPRDRKPLSHLLESKAEVLLADLDSEVDSIQQAALDGLWLYVPAQGDFPLFLDAYPKYQNWEKNAWKPFSRILLSFDEAAGRRAVEDAYRSCEDDRARLYLLQLLLNSELEANRLVGVSLLEEGFPSLLGYFEVSNFFQGVQNLDALLISRPKLLESLLSHPWAFVFLVDELEGRIYEKEWPAATAGQVYDAVLDQAEEELFLGEKGLFSEEMAYNAGQAFGKLAEIPNSIGWTERRVAFARQVMALGPEGSRSKAAMALLKGGHEVPRDQLRGVADDFDSGYLLLDLLVREGKTELLPKKYFAPAHLAEMALRHYAASNRMVFDKLSGLEQIELLKKEEVWWEGQDMDVFVFRCAFPRDSEWRMGICGPFPQEKGVYPDHLDFLFIGNEGFNSGRYADEFEELLDSAKKSLLWED